jgi:hypothetical protein
MLEYGKLPLVSDLTKIGCQVWYSPWLTAEQRRHWSVWSLRLTVSIMNHRVIEEINVRLFPFKQFYASAHKPQYRTDPVLAECDAIQEGGYGGDIWAGFVQGFTDGGGRPFVKEQVAFLIHHEMDKSPKATQARVALLLDGELLVFDGIRPAAGDSEKSSLWYCQWKPERA